MSQVMIRDFPKRSVLWQTSLEEKYTPEERNSLSILRETIEGRGLRTFLQPLVDFQKGSIHGYEMLSRGIFPLESPANLFETARRWSLHRQLDKACCLQALNTLKTLHFGKNSEEKRFFLNINPSSFCDVSFRQLLLPENLEKYGLFPHQLVLELTEGERAEEGGDIYRALGEFRRMGYGIALDDLGAGYSGIRTISLCVPEYIKLDISLIRGIHKNPYGQKVLSGIREMASHVGSRIIAEGVETREELETLASLGLRYAQGYFFEKPLPSEEIDPRSITKRLGEIRKSLGPFLEEELETVFSLLERDLVVEEGALDVEGAGRIFSKHEEADHLVILEKGYPKGLLTRNEYSLRTGGAFGYHLYQKHPVEEIATPDFLAVLSSCPVTEAARKAMERGRKELYDPLVVVGADGLFLGTVTMKRIIERASTLEVDLARSCNPLSGLPGNTSIERWIRGVQASGEEATLLYVDLDRFKEYNDRYGFLQGDRMISLTASVLRKSLESFPPRSRLGHVGGDDFVVVCSGEVRDEAMEELCRLFDGEKKVLFEEKDLVQGGYTAKTRSGEKAFAPLVTLSCALVNLRDLQDFHLSEHLSQIVAALKSEVKSKTAKEGRSLWLRRQDAERMGREDVVL